jgi:hypothetical protein
LPARVPQAPGRPLGTPIIPVVVRSAGRLLTPRCGFLVRVGEVLHPGPSAVPGDQLAAAELAEQVREAIAALLARVGGPSEACRTDAA